MTAFRWYPYGYVPNVKCRDCGKIEGKYSIKVIYLTKGGRESRNKQGTPYCLNCGYPKLRAYRQKKEETTNEQR